MFLLIKCSIIKSLYVHVCMYVYYIYIYIFFLWKIKTCSIWTSEDRPRAKLRVTTNTFYFFINTFALSFEILSTLFKSIYIYIYITYIDLDYIILDVLYIHTYIHTYIHIYIYKFTWIKFTSDLYLERF